MKNRYIIAFAIAGLLLIPTHHLWMGSKHDFHFDLMLLLIVLILGYFLSLKLTSYLANFKSIKHQSRIEIIFLVLFFIFLFIPMSHISKADISKTENRTLAIYKPLVIEKKLNYDYGKNFNEWFNDRFYLRDKIIKIYDKIKYHIAGNIYFNGNYFYNKKTHWAFNKNWFMLPDYSADFPLYKENILKLKQFCDENNIKLYILIAPQNGEVYKEEVYPFKYKINNGLNFTNYMNRQGYDFVISPYNELRKESKKEFTYSKSDVHWVEHGGFISYKILMNRIKKDFPDLHILNNDDIILTKSKYGRTDYNGGVKIGNIFRDLHFSEKYLDAMYINYDFKDRENVIRSDFDAMVTGTETSTYKNAKNKQKVYVIGTSYEENLVNFLMPSFSSLIKRRFNTVSPGTLDMDRYEQNITDIRPDICIIILNTNNILHLTELYNKGDKNAI